MSSIKILPFYYYYYGLHVTAITIKDVATKDETRHYSFTVPTAVALRVSCPLCYAPYGEFCYLSYDNANLCHRERQQLALDEWSLVHMEFFRTLNYQPFLLI